jgi:hypothetical protein
MFLPRFKRLPLALVFILIFLSLAIISVSVMVPEKAPVIIGVLDRYNKPENVLIYIFDNSSGQAIASGNTVNGNAQFFLPKGFYTLKVMKDGASIEINQTTFNVTDSFQRKIITLQEKLYFFSIKVYDSSMTHREYYFDETTNKIQDYHAPNWLDNTTIRIELCAEPVVGEHTVGLMRSLPYRYIFQDDGSIRECFFWEYGVSKPDHANRNIYYGQWLHHNVKEGYFYCPHPLPEGNYIIKVWDGCHLIGKLRFHLNRDATYSINVPYEIQERINFIRLSGQSQSNSRVTVFPTFISSNGTIANYTVTESQDSTVKQLSALIMNSAGKSATSQVYLGLGATVISVACNVTSYTWSYNGSTGILTITSQTGSNDGNAYTTTQVTTSYISGALPSGEYDYLIVTSDTLTSTFQTLANWKASKGLRVVIYPLSTIYGSYSGYDNAEKVRNFIKDAYNTWSIKWVLLGGDAGVVPVRYVYNPDGSGDTITTDYTPTDFYYAGLEGTWDADGDHIYGESASYCAFGIDEADFTPEVYVGRFPVNTVTQANNIITKTVNYEQNIFVSTLFKALFGGAVLDYDYSTDGAYVANYIINNFMPSAFTEWKLYNWNSDHGYPSSYNNLTESGFVNYLNQGPILVTVVGHGNTGGLYDKSGTAILTKSDVSSLTSTTLCPIFFTTACQSAAWDVKERSFLQLSDDSLAEYMLVYYSNKGAVAYIGSTRISWFWTSDSYTLNGLDNGLTALFWKEVFSNGKYQLGLAFYSTLRDYVLKSQGFSTWSPTRECERKDVFALTLLGDPEMAILHTWIETTARDANNNPLTSATITVTDLTTNYKYTLTTNANGFASLPMPYGQFKVETWYHGIKIYESQPTSSIIWSGTAKVSLNFKCSYTCFSSTSGSVPVWTNGSATIESSLYDSATQKLTLTFSAAAGTYVAGVDCTNFGKPVSVSGAGTTFTEVSSFAALTSHTWFYDASTKILYVKYICSSPATVEISWQAGGEGGATGGEAAGGGGGGGGGDLYCSISDYGPQDITITEGDMVDETITIKLYNMLGTDVSAKIYVWITDPSGNTLNSTTFSVFIAHKQTKFPSFQISFKPSANGTYTIHVYAEHPDGKTKERTKTILVTVKSKAETVASTALPSVGVTALGVIGIVGVAFFIFFMLMKQRKLTIKPLMKPSSVLKRNICSHCGASNLADAKYCENCGYKLEMSQS